MSISKPNPKIFFSVIVIVLAAALILYMVPSPFNGTEQKKTPVPVADIRIFQGITNVSFGSTGYTFPRTAVNTTSAPVRVVIQNDGTGDLVVEDIALVDGGDQFDLVLKKIEDTISPGEYTTFSISFTPTTMRTTATTIKILSNDPDRPQYEFAVVGTGIPVKSPENVCARAESGRVTLTWNEIAGTSYNLYWATSPGVTTASGTKISDVTSPYIHTDLTDGVTYYYIVTAENAYGEGIPSYEVSVRPDTSYYVDATSGNDANDGLSPATAWKTIGKVRESTFQPGDYILFKRGETWNYSLKVSSTGTAGTPITFGAYGEGNSPIISVIDSIPCWDIEKNWMNYSRNVWYIEYDMNARRLWLSEKEYVKAEFLENIDENSRWHYDPATSHLYVYAISNPATYYSSIEEAHAIDASSVYIINKDHIRVRDLELRGGLRTVSVLGSSHVIIDNCTIGWGGGIGVWISRYNEKSSDFGIIRNCIIDSGFRLSYLYEKAQSEDGIHMRNNADQWEIYNCEIKNWGHTGISLWQENKKTSVSHNKIYSNFFTTHDVSYGRAFETKGWAGGCSYNEFYKNYVRDVKGSIQIGGSNNSVYYNIIDTVKNTPVYPESTVSAIILTPVTTPSGYSEKYVSNHNRILNNVIYGCDGEGIKIEGWDKGYEIKYNSVINNIIINCGKNSTHDRENVGIHIQHQGYADGNEYVTAANNTIQNNLIYVEGASEIISYNWNKMTVDDFNENEVYGDEISRNIQANPMFVDPLCQDFHLQFSSPAIDRGEDVGLTRDFEGTAVPQGARADIGAFEYH